MQESETPYANITEVADYFRVSISTIRKWLQSGQIPTSTYIKISDVYRFRLSAVEEALTKVSNEALTHASTAKKDGE